MWGVMELRERHKKISLGLALTAAVVMTSSVSATELSSSQIYASTAPAVVFIAAVVSEGTSMGTGSIIDANGLVLTNSHVIFDESTNAPAKKVFVYLKPDRITGNRDNIENLTRRYPATVLAYDGALDLAILKIEKLTEPLPVIQLTDPARTAIGARVFAIGHPEQGGLWSLTTGVISAEWNNFETVQGKDVFQTETSINHGNSGGPLLDTQGYQVGINSNGARVSKDGSAITGVNFAIKSSVAKGWLARKGQYVAYARDDQQEKERGATPENASPQQKQPEKVLENQPEAKPETGPGLPPLRPYSIDNLLKRLDLVQKDLEKQMDDMGAEIEKRRRR